jgi:uncharacterized protein with PIN domain
MSSFDLLPARQVRFLCDAMLGSLCRWLRLFGYDAEFGGVLMADRELEVRAAAERRLLVTRDRELASIGPRTMLVRGTELEDQLVEVLTRLSLNPIPTLEHSRCAVCNGALQDVTREEVAGLVPPYTWRTASRFRQCGSCGRVFWPGTHGDRICARLQRVVVRLGPRVSDDGTGL